MGEREVFVMKKYLSFILVSFILLSFLAACNNQSESGTDKSEMQSCESSFESKSEEAKKQTYSDAERTLANLASCYTTEDSFYSIWRKNNSKNIKSVCDENEYIAATLVRDRTSEIKRSIYYIYNGLEHIKYTIEISGKDRLPYNIHIGVLPEEFVGKTAEEFIRGATDYYETLEMKSGYACVANERLDYVYHSGTETQNACAVAVYGEKWFIAVRPVFNGITSGKSPESLFDDFVFEARDYANGIKNMVICADRYISGTVVLEKHTGAIYENTKSTFSVYDEDGSKKNEFEAFSFYPVFEDKTKRLWCRDRFTKNGVETVYCNRYGEKTAINAATQIAPFDSEKGEFLGIIDGRIYIFDGDGRRESFLGEYVSVKKLGKTEAVKFSDAIYAIIQNDEFVRIYTTDFDHESAALEYNEEYDAVLVGGDAITEIINRYGEIIEAYWYNAHGTAPFTVDKSGKYLLTCDEMSLYGNTYILDSDSMHPLAHLPNGADYKFTKDGKLHISYTDYENDGEYVEFTAEIKNAIKNFPFDKETHDSGCNCFDGYPKKEDFE